MQTILHPCDVMLQYGEQYYSECLTLVLDQPSAIELVGQMIEWQTELNAVSLISQIHERLHPCV